MRDYRAIPSEGDDPEGGSGKATRPAGPVDKRLKKLHPLTASPETKIGSSTAALCNYNAFISNMLS
jgi:hypothetical protein